MRLRRSVTCCDPSYLGVVPANQPRLQGQPESSICMQPLRNTMQPLCRSLVVAKCLGATGDSNSAGDASAGAVPRILPCFCAGVGAALRRRRCAEHGALDRCQFPWSAAAPWDVTSRTAGWIAAAFQRSCWAEPCWMEALEVELCHSCYRLSQRRGLGSVAARFRRHEEVHTMPSPVMTMMLLGQASPVIFSSSKTLNSDITCRLEHTLQPRIPNSHIPMICLFRSREASREDLRPPRTVTHEWPASKTGCQILFQCCYLTLGICSLVHVVRAWGSAPLFLPLALGMCHVFSTCRCWERGYGY